MVTPEDIERELGTFEERDQKAQVLAQNLYEILEQLGYTPYSPVFTGTTPMEKIQSMADNEAIIEYRAKTIDSIQKKHERSGDTINEILDTLGLLVVVSTIKKAEQCALHIHNNLWDHPTKEQMTLRNGSLIFAPYRDYRKRDWEGVSPLTDPDYRDVININRSVDGRVIEVRIMSHDMFLRYNGEGRVGHRAFKKRQEELLRQKKAAE
ncbi:MAG: hypothetical protein WC045_02220 [Patescibacteria group bacterium]